ncbi:MAG: ribonuclease P protein component [Bacilli bacterium]|nr:ribonuclease P protein component [Bacilli bacterium]
MKKYEIVKEHEDFNNIINTGRYKKGKFFVIYNKDNNLDHNRYGIAVSKKNGNAVIRNKLKRQARMILMTNKNMFKNNFDYIIIIKRNAVSVDYKELEEDLLNIIKGE